jgi:hypothetical protein
MGEQVVSMAGNNAKLYREFDISKVHDNGSTALPGLYAIEKGIYKTPLGKLGLDPDSIPEKLEFVKDSYPVILLDNVKKGTRKKGILRGPFTGAYRGLQRCGTKFFHNNSEDGHAIISNPGGWEALDNFYVDEPKTWVDKGIHMLPAVKGTKQRLNKYVELQKGAAIDAYKRHGKVRHLELFSGPARAPLTAYSELIADGMDSDKIELVCIDVDSGAGKKALELAHEKGVSDILTFNVYNAKHAHLREKGVFGIVSSHGGYDYLSDDNLAGFTEKISTLQNQGDWLFSTNMLPIKYHKDCIAVFCMKGFGGWNQIIEREEYEPGRLIEKSGVYGDIKTYAVTPKGSIQLDGKPGAKDNGASGAWKNIKTLLGPRKVHVINSARKKQERLEL